MNVGNTACCIAFYLFLISLLLPVYHATLPPFGHRVYTYQQTPSGIISKFNNLPGSSNATITTVNAYGGWFSRFMTKVSLRCTNTNVPTSPSARRFIVKNTEATTVSIIACAADGCKHDEYVHCSGSVPANSEAVVTMDNNIHFMIMLYNASFTQECWPKTYGVFPNLKLPLQPGDCAKVPSGPNPALPSVADADVKLEPGASNIEAFSKVTGVEHITLVFDGRMDLCKLYDMYNMSNRVKYPCDSHPSLINITSKKLDDLAQEVASIACANPLVSGVQIDLEPLANPWRDSTIDAIGRMSKALRTGNCIDDTHPNGRYISTFTFAESVDDTLLEALNINGMLSVSGYDLYPDNVDTRFNTPEEYGKKLQRQVEAVLKVTGGISEERCSIPWVLGLPVAASAHEYKSYIPNPEHCGPACTPYNNDADMTDYVKAAFDYIQTRPDVFYQDKETSCFRGFTFWKFDGIEIPKNGGGDYPPKSGNRWSPLGPLPTDLIVLKNQLGSGSNSGNDGSPLRAANQPSKYPLFPVVAAGGAVGVALVGGLLFALRKHAANQDSDSIEEPLVKSLIEDGNKF
jgi:hypothetical protein